MPPIQPTIIKFRNQWDDFLSGEWYVGFELSEDDEDLDEFGPILEGCKGNM
jgi:hypothetical protein